MYEYGGSVMGAIEREIESESSSSLAVGEVPACRKPPTQRACRANMHHRHKLRQILPAMTQEAGSCSEFFQPRPREARHLCLPSAGLTQQFGFCSAKLAENTFASSDASWVRTDTSKIWCQRRSFQHAHAATITPPMGTLPANRLTIVAIVSLITYHL